MMHDRSLGNIDVGILKIPGRGRSGFPSTRQKFVCTKC